MKKILLYFTLNLTLLFFISLVLDFIKFDIGFDRNFFLWILLVSATILLTVYSKTIIGTLKYYSSIRSFKSFQKPASKIEHNYDSKYWRIYERAKKIFVFIFGKTAFYTERFTNLLSELSKNNLVIPTIILSGIILRLFLIGKLPVTNDEGSYLYDASLINRGLIPYKDFLTKSVPHIYLISVFDRLLGSSIFSGRLFTVGLFLASAILTYLITKKIFNRKTAIISLFVFSLYPEIASLTSYAQIQQIQMFLCLLFVYLIVREKFSLPNLFIMATVIFFAYISRPTSIIFVPVFLIYLSYLFIKGNLSFIDLITKSLFFGLFILILGLGIFALIYPQIGLTKSLDFFGIETLSQSGPSANQLNVLSSLLLRLSNGLAFFRFLSNMPILLANLFLLFFLGFFKKNKYLIIILGLFLPISFFLAVRSIYFIYFSPVLTLSYLPESILVFIMTAMIFITVVKKPINETIKNARKHSVVILAWFVMIASLYAFWIKFNEPYFIEFIPILILSLGFLYRFIEDNEFKKVRIVFIVLIMIGASLSQIRSFTRFYTGTYSPEIVNEVGGIIRANTGTEDKVMTASLIFPYIAGRKVPYDIGHPYWYGYSFIDQKLISEYMPEYGEYVKEMNSNPPKIIVYDKTTDETFFKNSRSMAKLLKTKYKRILYKRTGIKNVVEIYKRISE